MQIRGIISDISLVPRTTKTASNDFIEFSALEKFKANRKLFHYDDRDPSIQLLREEQFHYREDLDTRRMVRKCAGWCGFLSVVQFKMTQVLLWKCWRCSKIWEQSLIVGQLG
jgi:hypothetical protein